MEYRYLLVKLFFFCFFTPPCGTRYTVHFYTCKRWHFFCSHTFFTVVYTKETSSSITHHNLINASSTASIGWFRIQSQKATNLYLGLYTSCKVVTSLCTAAHFLHILLPVCVMCVTQTGSEKKHGKKRKDMPSCKRFCVLCNPPPRPGQISDYDELSVMRRVMTGWGGGGINSIV